MDDVRTKLQSKEDMIAQLEKRLRSQSASGTLRLSPSHSLLLQSKASPLRDILLTGPYMSNKARAIRNANRDFNFKSPPETARSSSKCLETPNRTLTSSACYGESPSTFNSMPASPYVDYKFICKGTGDRSNVEHGVKTRQDGQDTNISYIEPVMASTMLGQSMFEASPALQSGQKHVSFLDSKKTLSKNIPFGSYASPARQRKRSVSGPAASIVMDYTENSDSSIRSGTYAPSNTRVDNKENSDRRVGELESILKKQHKELPFEHPLTPVTSPKYMDIFKEQMVQKRINQSSMNQTVNSSSLSTSMRNQSKIASLVEKFEFSSNTANNSVIKTRSIRRRSKSYKKHLPLVTKEPKLECRLEVIRQVN